jgi:hypothetical protein
LYGILESTDIILDWQEIIHEYEIREYIGWDGYDQSDESKWDDILLYEVPCEGKHIPYAELECLVARVCIVSVYHSGER